MLKDESLENDGKGTLALCLKKAWAKTAHRVRRLKQTQQARLERSPFRIIHTCHLLRGENLGQCFEGRGYQTLMFVKACFVYCNCSLLLCWCLFRLIMYHIVLLGVLEFEGFSVFLTFLEFPTFLVCLFCLQALESCYI